MTEWWTYRPSDFLMFSPRTYWRLIELHNLDVWPWHLAALLLGGGLCWAALRGGARATGLVFAALAWCWLVVAWTWHLQRYASINTAAPVFAGLFAVQALLLAALAVVRPALQQSLPRAAQVLLLAALIIYPFIGLAAGREWAQAEVFGIAPDPTVLATLAVLLVWRPALPQRPQRGRGRWLWRAAWPIPLLWCLGSGLTLWNLQAPDAPLLPAAALLALWIAWRAGQGR